MPLLSGLSFRAKLLLSMLLVIVGVSGVTLYVTEKRATETYSRFFRRQFETELDFFLHEQEDRLKDVKEKSQQVTSTQRVKAAMKEGEAEPIYDDVFIVLEDMRKKNMMAAAPSAAPRPGPGKNAKRAQRNAAPQRIVAWRFCRILDEQGKVLATTNDLARFNRTQDRRSADMRLSADLGKRVAELQTQQIAYMANGAGTNAAVLETIVTPIFDPDDTGKTIGALAIGFPIDLGEHAMEGLSNIKSGLLLDGVLHSKTIPQNTQAALVTELQKEIAASEEPRDQFVFAIGDVPHRVFYRKLNPDSPFPVAYEVALYSLAELNKEQRAFLVQIGGISGLVLLTAVALMAWISHKFSVSIRELVAATIEIQQGNFAIKVPVRTQDEIGHLATSFNEMAVGLAQKEKFKSVLDKVADKEVAEQLMSGQLVLGGEAREVSILFCDIRGFTPLTEDMPPAEVIQMLNEHMTELTRVVYENNGVVDKFVGDLIMAVFGAPKTRGNDTYNAVRCALSMIVERQKLNESSQHNIRMGIGIATGEVVAGCMGSEDRLNYTVLGERVNLAARLCSKAGPMEVVIDQATREKLGDALTVETLQPVPLKGFSDPVQTFKLIAVDSLQPVA
jgi:class 3 adenylate cyclase